MGVRITTWNVNGIRNPFGYQPWRDGKTFDAMFDILEADIVIMQELKIQWKDLRDDMVLVPGWDCYFSLPRHKKGYSGVGIYTRNSVCAPIRAEEGLLGVLTAPNSSVSYRDLPAGQSIGGYPSPVQLADIDVDPAILDAEGRCVVLEFPAFVLFGIYSPANSSGLRSDFRLGFIAALDARIRNLIAKGKRVVVTGDLNVSRSELDTANAVEILRKEGISHEEYISTPNRRIFNQLVEGAEVIGERDEGREQQVLWDICRGFHPSRKGMYTHWEQKKNARPGNYGSRIDYILCSLEMKPWFCESNIQEGLMGSDHCPVYAVMKDVIDWDRKELHLRDIMNSSGMFESGTRLKDYTLKDACALSGKLLTGLDKRRSILDMFGNKPAALPTSLSQSSPFEETAWEDELAESTNKPNESTETIYNIAEEPKTLISNLSGQMLPTVDSGAIPASLSSQSPERKKRTATENKAPPTKRSKSNLSSSASATPTKGQKSLRNFFTSKASVQKDDQAEDTQGTEPSEPEIYTQAALRDRETTATEINNSDGFRREETSTDAVQQPPTSVAAAEDPPSPPLLVDPIVSKESWGKLFSKPSVPRCEGHSEPCQLMKTKKKGFNCGREFYMCSRPLGPTGEKERNSQWRCGTFIWASDTNTKSESNV